MYRYHTIRKGAGTAAVFFVRNCLLKTVLYPNDNTKRSDVYILFADDVETGADHFAMFCT